MYSVSKMILCCTILYCISAAILVSKYTNCDPPPPPPALFIPLILINNG